MQVFFGNLAGSLFFAAILVHCTFFELHIPLFWLILLRHCNRIDAAIYSVYSGICHVNYKSLLFSTLSITHNSDIDSKKAGTPEWHQIFLRGIGCNWLVCIAIWVRRYNSVILRKLSSDSPMSSKR